MLHTRSTRIVGDSITRRRIVASPTIRPITLTRSAGTGSGPILIGVRPKNIASTCPAPQKATSPILSWIVAVSVELEVKLFSPGIDRRLYRQCGIDLLGRFGAFQFRIHMDCPNRDANFLPLISHHMMSLSVEKTRARRGL
jgi:hypothetical protein